MDPINYNNNIRTIKDFTPAQRFVRGMESRGLGPLILLECFVTGGRTLQAYKRGGFIEARERFTEESIGALFWFAGVKVFNKINDYLLRHLLKLKNKNFYTQKDAIRNPLANYMSWTKKEGHSISQSKIGVFKFTKVATSIILANALVGFVVPKINQAITRAYRAKNPDKAENQPKFTGLLPVKNINQFTNSKKGVSFTGNFSENLLKLAYNFENNTYYQLLSTDAGITAGRTISARNTPERIEVLWRDLISIFFYMFSMPLVNKLLNGIQGQKNKSRLNPVGARQVTDYMNQVMKNGMKPEAFKALMLGDASKAEKILPKFKFENGAIKLDNFLKVLEKEVSPEEFEKYSDLAKRMSKLQPKNDGVTLLAKSQVKAIFEGGCLNKPEFWDEVFTVEKGFDKSFVDATNKGIANHKNPFRFIAQKDLDGIIDNVKNYVNGVIKKAVKQGKEIDSKTLEKAYKNNMFKNSLNWTVAFGISALFLSTIIPKIQYWITKITTGSDKFPGVTEYPEDKKTDEKAT